MVCLPKLISTQNFQKLKITNVTGLVTKTNFNTEVPEFSNKYQILLFQLTNLILIQQLQELQTKYWMLLIL